MSELLTVISLLMAVVVVSAVLVFRLLLSRLGLTTLGILTLVRSLSRAMTVSRNSTPDEPPVTATIIREWSRIPTQKDDK